MLDNTTAIAYINSMGGRKSQCNQITWDLWVWFSTHNIWLIAVHIPGKQNVLADKESREKHSDIEWKLNTQLFEGFNSTLGHPLNRPFCLQKVEQDQSQGKIIVPLWTTQVWFPRLFHMLTDYPITLPKGPRTLSLPSNQERVYPPHKKLALLGCKLSGIPSQ